MVVQELVLALYQELASCGQYHALLLEADSALSGALAPAFSSVKLQSDMEKPYRKTGHPE